MEKQEFSNRNKKNENIFKAWFNIIKRIFISIGYVLFIEAKYRYENIE